MSRFLLIAGPAFSFWVLVAVLGICLNAWRMIFGDHTSSRENPYI